MESFQRSLVIKDLKLWLYNNHQYLKNKPKQESKPIIKDNNTTTELLINIDMPCVITPEITHGIMAQPKKIEITKEEFIYEI
jgi:hypothetical protein